MHLKLSSISLPTNPSQHSAFSNPIHHHPKSPTPISPKKMPAPSFLLSILLTTLLLLLSTLSSAQFQFFEQMFQQPQQQQQQQQQNVASDSVWYQQTYDSGMLPPPSSPSPPSLAHPHSALHKLPLPFHPRLRALPAPLPLRLPSPRR